MKKSVGAVIYFKDKYLIQKRSNKKNIYFPNLFGVFGGNVEKKEKIIKAVIREIFEELNIKLNSKQVKFFLKISFYSRHFLKNRSRFYFFVKILKSQLNSINLKEGQSYHFINISKIKKLDFVPWDLSAILYFDKYVRKNKSIKPKRV